MTPQEAKELSLEVWEFRKRYPQIRYKNIYPEELREKIQYYNDMCPLYDLHWQIEARCRICPLQECVGGGLYEAWQRASDEDTRRAAATKIVEILKAWEPDNE
jgi:hypothetical protein